MDMKILGEVQFNGKPLLVVESGVGGYVNGIFTRLLLVPPSCIDTPMENPVEIVTESTT